MRLSSLHIVGTIGKRKAHSQNFCWFGFREGIEEYKENITSA